MATWPVDLPQNPLRENYSAEMGQDFLFSETSVGPPKSRRRSSFAPDTHQISIFAETPAQIASFITFHRAEGANPFDWIDPNTGLAASVRIVNQPSLVPYGKQGRRISFEMEVIR